MYQIIQHDNAKSILQVKSNSIFWFKSIQLRAQISSEYQTILKSQPIGTY